MRPYSQYDVIEVKIVGLPYHDYEKAKPFLKGGYKLVLRREPDNTHDKNAIAAYFPAPNGNSQDMDLMLGYLPKEEAAVLAPLFDSNLCTSVTATCRDWHTNDAGLEWLIAALDLRDLDTGEKAPPATVAGKTVRHPRRASGNKVRIDVWL